MLIKPLFIRLFGSTLYAYSTKGSGSISPTVVRRVTSPAALTKSVSIVCGQYEAARHEYGNAWVDWPFVRHLRRQITRSPLLLPFRADLSTAKKEAMCRGKRLADPSACSLICCHLVPMEYCGAKTLAVLGAVHVSDGRGARPVGIAIASGALDAKKDLAIITAALAGGGLAPA